MKTIVISTFILSLALLPLNASVYKGQKYFKKNCLSCHGKALKFVTEKSYDTWLGYLEGEGDVLYDVHTDSDEASAAMKYFDDDHYRRKFEHYRDFFLEYASDTGNIPACE